MQVITSYGASGDQSRGVVDGKPADVVNFSVEPDITRLVKAGKVSKDWNTDATKGIPFGSVVTLVVRKGNSEEHQGLGRPTAARGRGHHAQPAEFGLGQVESACAVRRQERWRPATAKRASISSASWYSEHVKLRPGSGREATDVFVQGSGDVLISYENEAIATERAGKPVEHVIPPQTFKIENPVAVVTTSAHLDAAIAFKNFQYTAAAQKVWAQAGFRPVDPAVAADFRDQYPVPAKLWTIADLGGWGDGGSAAVRQEHRQHHQDLHAGHRMTRDHIVDRTAGPDAQAPPGARHVRGSGTTSLRVGVAMLWLSVIVLLPLAAIAWQAVGGGWQAFWLAVTSNAALESFRVTLTISVGGDCRQPGLRPADRLGAGARRLRRQTARRRDHRSAVRAAHHRRQPGDAGPVRQQQPGGSSSAAHRRGVWRWRWPSSRCRSWCAPFSRCCWKSIGRPRRRRRRWAPPARRSSPRSCCRR